LLTAAGNHWKRLLKLEMCGITPGPGSLCG